VTLRDHDLLAPARDPELVARPLVEEVVEVLPRIAMKREVPRLEDDGGRFAGRAGG
jgi:hypothetical protein